MSFFSGFRIVVKLSSQLSQVAFNRLVPIAPVLRKVITVTRTMKASKTHRINTVNINVLYGNKHASWLCLSGFVANFGCELNASLYGYVINVFPIAWACRAWAPTSKKVDGTDRYKKYCPCHHLDIRYSADVTWDIAEFTAHPDGHRARLQVVGYYNARPIRISVKHRF